VLQFQKQLMMRKVLYSLIPIFLFSIYLYGFNAIVIPLVVFPLGILTEYLFARLKKNGKVSEAVLITCSLYSLSLPPATPLWIAGIGIIFGVMFGKMVYGGFGRNIFNPAITARLFIYITFPTVMNQAWKAPGSLGFFPDGITAATPMALMRAGESSDLKNLILGLRSGTLGESAIILIILAAGYLIYTKTANWRLILSMVLSGGLLSLFLDLAGVSQALPELPSLFSGSFLFVAVFMVTDPVTAPKKPEAQWVYGFIVGVTTILVRTFSLFPEGTSFGILMGNTFSALIDEAVINIKKKGGKK